MIPHEEASLYNSNGDGLTKEGVKASHDISPHPVSSDLCFPNAVVTESPVLLVPGWDDDEGSRLRLLNPAFLCLLLEKTPILFSNWLLQYCEFVLCFMKICSAWCRNHKADRIIPFCERNIEGRRFV